MPRTSRSRKSFLRCSDFVLEFFVVKKKERASHHVLLDFRSIVDFEHEFVIVVFEKPDAFFGRKIFHLIESDCVFVIGHPADENRFSGRLV